MCRCLVWQGSHARCWVWLCRGRGTLADRKEKDHPFSCVFNWVQPPKPCRLLIVKALLLLLWPELTKRAVLTPVQLAEEGEILSSLSHRQEGLRIASTGLQMITVLVSLPKIPCDAFGWSLDPKTFPIFPPVWTEQYPGNYKLPLKTDFPKENKRDLRLEVMSM